MPEAEHRGPGILRLLDNAANQTVFDFDRIVLADLFLIAARLDGARWRGTCVVARDQFMMIRVDVALVGEHDAEVLADVRLGEQNRVRQTLVDVVIPDVRELDAEARAVAKVPDDDVAEMPTMRRHGGSPSGRA